jgi:hypothetical protein
MDPPRLLFLVSTHLLDVFSYVTGNVITSLCFEFKYSKSSFFEPIKSLTLFSW